MSDEGGSVAVGHSISSPKKQLYSRVTLSLCAMGNIISHGTCDIRRVQVPGDVDLLRDIYCSRDHEILKRDRALDVYAQRLVAKEVGARPPPPPRDKRSTECNP